MQTNNPPELRVPSPDQHLADFQYHERDEVFFASVFAILRSYRGMIGLTVAGVAVLYFVTALIAYSFAHSERIASVEFRLIFVGADKGEYPNGLKFSTSEILATPVLNEVFSNNTLKSYFGGFEGFKNSIFMVEANPERELLDYEYQAKLADTRLAMVDRSRIETEYKEKRKSFTAVQYSLNLRHHENSVTIPSALVSKILSDILAVWARQADQRKGALRYDVPVYSRNILRQEFIENEDYLIRVDILRSTVNRILWSLDEIAKLPGALLVRTGPESIGLREIRVNLEDILRFKLEPLFGTIRAAGLSKDPRLLASYLDNQLFQTRLERDEAVKKAQALQDSLRSYMTERGMPTSIGGQQTAAGGNSTHSPGALQTPALIPQFGESFLDRLVGISNQNSDFKYRQDLTDKIIKQAMTTPTLEKEVSHYENLLTLTRGFGTGTNQHAGDKAAVAAMVKARTEEATAGIYKGLDQVNKIYVELSSQNLNPQTMLYEIVRPFSIRTEQSLKLRSVVLYGVLSLLTALFLGLVGSLIHHCYRTGQAASRGE